MEVIVRVDGGPDIGYGHLVRSGALAAELRSRGHRVTFATTTPGPLRKVCTPTAVVTLPSRGEPAPFLNRIGTLDPDVVFTDAYPVDSAYQRAVRDRVPLGVLQDDSRHTVAADLFVNGNLYAQDLAYEFAGSRPKTCLGTDYLLLRERIRELADRQPPWRPDPVRALVTMGGSDVENLTPFVVRAFDGFDIAVDVIVGPGFDAEQVEEIREAASEVSNAISITRDPDDLPERMFEADFGVCTASSTTYELLALGTPLVCFPVADNQQPIAAALDDQDAGIVLGRDADEAAIHSALATYATEPGTRRDRRERGRSLVDGHGTERVARNLIGLP